MSSGRGIIPKLGIVAEVDAKIRARKRAHHGRKSRVTHHKLFASCISHFIHPSTEKTHYEM
jgi:hypothetical protein